MSKISQPEFLTRLEIRFSSNSSIWSICKHHIELDILVILYTRNIFAAVKRYYCRKNNLMDVRRFILLTNLVID